jgi:Cu2+-containing amine oxidase
MMTAPVHPLDPASAEEYLAGREIMAKAGLCAAPVRFAYYGLQDAAKADVLAGRETDRQLRAYLVNTDTGESTDVVVSLTRGEVVRTRTLDPVKDGQMPILDENSDYDDEAVRGPHRTTLKPVEITQPDGPSFTLDGYALSWQGWSMRIGFDAREGLSLQPVRQRDRAEGDPADPRVAGSPPYGRCPRPHLENHQQRTGQPLCPSHQLHALPGAGPRPAGRPGVAAGGAGRVRGQPPVGDQV